LTNQETQKERSPKGLEMLKDDIVENEIIQQEQRSLEEKQPIFVVVDNNTGVDIIDSIVAMESLENLNPCPTTN
jgi:cephalosporin hydroxylase